MSLQLSILGDFLGLAQDEKPATPTNYQVNEAAWLVTWFDTKRY